MYFRGFDLRDSSWSWATFLLFATGFPDQELFDLGEKHWAQAALAACWNLAREDWMMVYKHEVGKV